MKNSRKISMAITLVFLSMCLSLTMVQAADVVVENATQFKDTAGNIIHAHGGGMIKSGSYYYWYGEHRDPNGFFLGVSCYRSTDLKNWENRGDVLTKNSATELNSCWVERPKVMYNASTGQYIMWMHWEDGVNYGKARAAVAYGSSPDGSFTYQGSFRPYQNQGVTDHGLPGYMSRDCNVFVDTDGTGYFISSSNENMDLHLYRLTSDYRNISTLVTKLFVGSQREAPCLFKRGSYYFLLTSGCTGWSPNQAKYAYSTSLSSGWSSLTNIGNPTTYASQPAYVIPVQGTSSTAYLYTGDQWAGAWSGKVMDSNYVWLPLTFSSNTSMSMSYAKYVTINAAAGSVTLGGSYSTAITRWEANSPADYFITHVNFVGKVAANPTLADSQWRLVPGLADPSGVSFESVSFPGYYLRHYNYELKLEVNSGSPAFKADATFKRVAGLADSSKASFQSYNYPTRYIRHYNYTLRIDPISTAQEKSDATFTQR